RCSTCVPRPATPISAHPSPGCTRRAAPRTEEAASPASRASTRPARSCAIDGDVEGALSAERLFVERRPAMFESKRGEPGHEVELGGPGEPKLRVYEADAVLGDPYLRGIEPLLVPIEHARVEAHAIERRLLHREVLA